MKKITAVIITLMLTFIFSGSASAQNNLELYLSIPKITDSDAEYIKFNNNQGSLSDNTEYFQNHIYVEAWGYALVSLNYQRLLPKYNIALGGGVGPNPYARNFTLDGDGGMVINAYFLKQFSLTRKFQLGFGVGSMYDFDGWYNEFWDPLFIKVSLSRYSVSLADDRMYYGLNLYYVQWANWSPRPSIKLGFSF